jgi:hypothetical protein
MHDISNYQVIPNPPFGHHPLHCESLRDWELMSNGGGFDVNGDADVQIQQYCKIRSDRYKKTVVGGLRPFIKGNNYAFFVDVLEPLSPKKRRSVLLRFNKDSLAVLNDNQIQKELSARAM